MISQNSFSLNRRKADHERPVSTNLGSPPGIGSGESSGKRENSQSQYGRRRFFFKPFGNCEPKMTHHTGRALWRCRPSCVLAYSYLALARLRVLAQRLYLPQYVPNAHFSLTPQSPVVRRWSCAPAPGMLSLPLANCLSDARSGAVLAADSARLLCNMAPNR